MNLSIRFFSCLFICFLTVKFLFAFDTLSDAEKYCKIYPEGVPMENNDFLDPEFTLLHKELEQKKPFWELLGLGKKLWTIENFKSLLSSVTKRLHIDGFYGDYIIKFTALPYTQFVIFGDLHGALHSFVRDLTYLKERGAINNNFKITRPDTYFVFNGNVVSGSPYILQVFTLVLKIMEVNPGRVFYIKGKDEHNKYWLNDGLRRELKKQIKHEVDTEKVPLEDNINLFFKSIPFAIYVANKPEQGVIRISQFGLDFAKINESSCIDIFKSFKVATLEKCLLFGRASLEQTELIRTIIKSEDRFKSYRTNTGLVTLEPDKGSTAWRIFSAPTYIYQKYFEFFYDAFTVFDIDKSFEDAKIALYNRDVRQLFGFENTASYNIITIKQPKPHDPLSERKKEIQISDDELLRFQNKLKNFKLKIETLSQEIFSLKNNINRIIHESSKS